MTRGHGMTAREYKAALDELGITGPGLARLLKVAPSTAFRWTQRGVKDARTVVLIRLLLDDKVTFKDIATRQ